MVVLKGKMINSTAKFCERSWNKKQFYFTLELIDKDDNAGEIELIKTTGKAPKYVREYAEQNNIKLVENVGFM